MTFLATAGTVQVTPTRQGIVQSYPEDGELPDWINASKNRVAMATDVGQLTISRNWIEVFRYFGGWEIFWFSLDSSYYGLTVPEVIGRAFSGEVAEIFDDFWNNSAWLHNQVYWAIFKIILMTFLGTLCAAMLALPLTFLAAKNFMRFVIIRFAVRRFFDYVRGVDALI